MTTNAYGTSSSGTSAVERYKYLLSTASPTEIEKAHEEAFAAMTAEERQQVLAALAQNGVSTTDSSASSLAQSATKLEMLQPGKLSSILGGTMSTGGTILTSLAGGFIGSAVFSGLTGGDGLGGRPGILARLFGAGRQHQGLLGSLGNMGGNFSNMNYGGNRQAQPPMPPQRGGGFGGERGGFGGPGGGHGGPGGMGGGFGGGPGAGGRF